MKERGDQRLNGFKKPIMFMGAVLIIVGGVLLFYLAAIVLQVINNPEEVKIVELVLSQVKIDEAVIFGSLDDRKFNINLSESSRLIVFLFLGIVMLSIIAGIIKVLIASGISIIKFAGSTIDSDNSKTI